MVYIDIGHFRNNGAGFVTQPLITHTDIPINITCAGCNTRFIFLIKDYMLYSIEYIHGLFVLFGHIISSLGIHAVFLAILNSFFLWNGIILWLTQRQEIKFVWYCMVCVHCCIQKLCITSWASYQICKIAGCIGNAGNDFPATAG